MNKSPSLEKSLPTPPKTRFFFDASSIFTLLECRYLNRFIELIPNFCITTIIYTELTKKDVLPKKIISDYVSSGKIIVIQPEILNEEKWNEYEILGLHIGEISILLTARKEYDVIVFDDLVARSVARVEGFSLTGLLGLLIALRSSSKLSQKESLSILSALNQTNFRMSAALYESVVRRLSEK